MCPSWRLALPAQTRPPGDLYLPLPWLDLQQLRKTPEGEGSRRRRLPGFVRQEGVTRLDDDSPSRLLPRLSVRQPQPRRYTLRYTSWRDDQDHRHDRPSIALPAL